jgi:hypothetical protein
MWLQADLGPLTPACRQSSAQYDFADPLIIVAVILLVLLIIYAVNLTSGAQPY